MGKVITNSQKERFIELRDEGLSFERIARKIDVSKPTALKLGKRYESGELQEELENLNPLAQKLKQFIDSGTQEISKRKLFADLTANQVVNTTLKAMQIYDKIRRTSDKETDDNIDDLLASTL